MRVPEIHALLARPPSPFPPPKPLLIFISRSETDIPCRLSLFMSIGIRRTGLALLIWFFSLLEVFIYTFTLFMFDQAWQKIVSFVGLLKEFFTLLILSTVSLFLMYYLKFFNSLFRFPDILWIFSSPFSNYHGSLRSLKRG